MWYFSYQRRRYESDMAVNLKHEKEKLDQICEQEERQINRVKQVLGIVERCQERSRPDSRSPLLLAECAEIFRQLQEDFYEEYKLFELSSLAVALVFPLVGNRSSAV